MLKKISSYAIVLVIGGALGTYFDAAHTIEEKIVTKDRIKTVIKEIVTERPDGSKVTERVTTKKEKKDSVANKKESIPVAKKWMAGVSYELFKPQPVYTIDIKRKLFTNIYAGAYGRSDGRFGVGVTILF